MEIVLTSKAAPGTRTGTKSSPFLFSAAPTATAVSKASAVSKAAAGTQATGGLLGSSFKDPVRDSRTLREIITQAREAAEDGVELAPAAKAGTVAQPAADKRTLREVVTQAREQAQEAAAKPR